jgi:cytochrome c
MTILTRFIAPAAALAVAGGLWASAAGASNPAPNGEQLFRQRCAACHAVAPGAPSPMGPNLAGVVGRKAGTAAGFNGYSPALKGSNITWTRAELDAFLAAPMRKVPGTRMVIAVPNPQQRAAIIQYMSTRPAR